jgi:hypothetical protein
MKINQTRRSYNTGHCCKAGSKQGLHLTHPHMHVIGFYDLSFIPIGSFLGCVSNEPTIYRKSNFNYKVIIVFQLALLSGVAALLRFPMPELEDLAVDSDSDSD